MNELLPIQCRCGTVRGTLSQQRSALRLICYCRDCQTYAHALGKAGEVLDSSGGTTIIAALQERVSFAQGGDKLACMSLTEKGIYRWYASCCNTPIANTTRRPQMSYVGLVHSCLALQPIEVTRRWPASLTVNAAHAKQSVVAPGSKALFGALAIARMVLGARFSGSWRQTPFFINGTPQPVSSPRVPSPTQLQAARSAV